MDDKHRDIGISIGQVWNTVTKQLWKLLFLRINIKITYLCKNTSQQNISLNSKEVIQLKVQSSLHDTSKGFYGYGYIIRKRRTKTITLYFVLSQLNSSCVILVGPLNVLQDNEAFIPVQPLSKASGSISDLVGQELNYFRFQVKLELYVECTIKLGFFD